MSHPLLSVRDLRRCVADRAVLDRVDIALEAGEILALVGANGAGKSTLIRTVLDLRAAHGGSVEIHGRAHTDRRARAGVAYLPERFQPPTYLTGHAFLATMAAFYGGARGESRNEEAAEHLAAELGLTDATLACSISTYSKGTAQLLGLTGCIASGRKLLLLDEPMDGLDPNARVRLRHVLEARRAAGASVLFSTHLLADAAELADRVAVLHEGRIVAEGTVAELCHQFEVDDLESVYLCCTGAVAQSG